MAKHCRRRLAATGVGQGKMHVLCVLSNVSVSNMHSLDALASVSSTEFLE